MVDNETLQSPPLSLSVCTLFYPDSEIIEKGIALPPPSLPITAATAGAITLQSGPMKGNSKGTGESSSNNVVEDNATSSKNDKDDVLSTEDMAILDANDK